jgi:hypothetical protein
MLQKNPDLDAVTAKAILQRTARWDLHTARPNPVYGWGKVDARAAVGESLISELTVEDADNRDAWSIETNARPGLRAYGDKVSSWVQMAAPLVGKDWIRTAIRSRLVKGDNVTVARFRMNSAATVYVCRRTTVTKPTWLNSWTGPNFANSVREGNNPLMPCWQKAFAKGDQVELKENTAFTAFNPNLPMYSVFISKP